ncbi:MAG: ABC transporter ATP-binding protein [Oscillospiraceae bacterium]|nr:ABC transporter ATP-binding protein [Oscillospiraceae bacterium]
MSNSLIEFRNFSFQYRAQKNPTLVNINLRIEKGEKILIAGPSGSGKSTLGSCLNGLIPFNNPGIITGELLIGGKAPTSVFDSSKLVGTVLQDTDAQFVGLTSAADVAFALENQAIPQSDMIRRVYNTCEEVAANQYAMLAPHNLSGGQKQRVSMAGILVNATPILLFDEPLASLDPYTGKLATELIDRIAQRSKCTVIIIEHRIEDVLHRHIDRVILMDNGRIIADCSPDEIVVSELLDEVGIRKPLYVKALERAGVVLLPDDKPGNLESLVLTDTDKESIQKWVNQAVSQELKTTNHQEETPLLELLETSFSYNITTKTKKLVLDNVSFKLFAGEMTAIIGANGAGKSTLAKLIIGFEEPDTGKIIYNGEDMSGLTIPERAERIGYVMQNPNQMICKPMIFDEVALGLRVRGFGEQEVRERVESVLEVCGLSKVIDWPISALSYGQKKRVTIADALVLRPQILILDEPTAGQDFRHYTDIMEFLLSLNASGVTVVLITHDMHLCIEYAKRALVFSNGELIADCHAYEALSDPELAKKASLRETSLYELARLCDIEDPKSLVRAYLS